MEGIENLIRLIFGLLALGIWVKFWIDNIGEVIPFFFIGCVISFLLGFFIIDLIPWILSMIIGKLTQPDPPPPNGWEIFFGIHCLNNHC